MIRTTYTLKHPYLVVSVWVIFYFLWYLSLYIYYAQTIDKQDITVFLRNVKVFGFVSNR